MKSCAGTHGICARIGGDEFIIFSRAADAADAEALAKQFNDSLATCNARLQKPYQRSASIGSIVKVAGECDSLYSMIQQADDKMYEIKKHKKAARKSEAVKP